MFGYIGSSKLGNIHVNEADITGSGETGGIFGKANTSTLAGVDIFNVSVENSTITGGEYFTGGIGGSLSGGSLTNSYSTGTNVLGGAAVGGLVGVTATGGKVINCYSTNAVIGNRALGGLVGFMDNPNTGNQVLNSYSTGWITGTGDQIEGLVGNAIG